MVAIEVKKKDKLTLSEFRFWLNKKFSEGKINNISEVEHWMDLFEKEYGRKE